MSTLILILIVVPAIVLIMDRKGRQQDRQRRQAREREQLREKRLQLERREKLERLRNR